MVERVILTLYSLRRERRGREGGRGRGEGGRGEGGRERRGRDEVGGGGKERGWEMKDENIII